MLSAVLDSCVLYPAPLRDFFMRLAVKLYQPKWTDAIHEEWIRNVLEDRPDLTLAQLTRTRELMNRHGGTCLVTGYETLIPTLTLPDPEMSALEQLSERKDLSKTTVLRQALRLYQLVDTRVS